ncbi:MAG: cation:proton antiporter [Rubrivivax sp.]|jgi:Kef-type K+ transport system membrane component KefB|nr:cation:proton antiporter [Rubrivivax sp.]
MTTVELFLVAMLVVFSLPYLVWRLGRTDYWAPLVVVQIVAGILLGPGVLGAAIPEWHAAVFTPAVIQALNGVAWWAVMLFVFIAGIELDLSQTWRHRRETAVTAGLAMASPLLLGAAVGYGMLVLGGWKGSQAMDWQFVAGIGMACSVTALPILVLLMDKMGFLRQPLGQRILRYASLDDIAIWAVLAVILMDWQRIGRQAIFLVLYAACGWLLRRLMERLPERDRWFVALIWLIICALGADWCGLHFMIGAFLAGAVIDARWFNTERLDQLRDNVLLVLMPVFFLSTGLRTQWDLGGWTVLLMGLALLVVAVGGKLVGVGLAARVLGWQRGEASLVGWLLQTKGLIEIIFASVLLDKGVINQATFTALLLMAVGSTMLTVPLVTPRVAQLKGLLRKAG